MTTTNADLQRAVHGLTLAMESAGLPVADLHVQTGSKTYGRAYRLYLRDPKRGGLSAVPGVYGDGFLGMTKSEAVQSLDMLAAGIRMTSQSSREAFDVRARFAASEIGR